MAECRAMMPRPHGSTVMSVGLRHPASRLAKATDSERVPAIHHVVIEEQLRTGFRAEGLELARAVVVEAGMAEGLPEGVGAWEIGAVAVLIDHRVDIGLELVQPAVYHPAGSDLDCLCELAGGLEYLDTVDEEPLYWVAPLLGEPAVAGELAPETPLVGPRLRRDGRACRLIVKAPELSVSIEYSVETASVADWLTSVWVYSPRYWPAAALLHTRLAIEDVDLLARVI